MQGVIICGVQEPEFCNECKQVCNSFGTCSLLKRDIPDYNVYNKRNKKPSWCPKKSVDGLVESIMSESFIDEETNKALVDAETVLKVIKDYVFVDLGSKK